MKNSLFLIFCLVFLTLNAQVGIGTNTPHPKALLDLESTTKGLLLPRLTDIDITNLGTEIPEGLIIYDKTNKKFLGWDGDSWQNLGYEEANTAPIASGLMINGNLEEGALLNGIYSYSDGEGDIDDNSVFVWNEAEDNAGLNSTPILGASTSSFTLTQSQLNKFIQFCVTPGSNSGASPGAMTCSTWEGPVTSIPTEVYFASSTITGVGEAAGTQNIVVSVNIANPSSIIGTTVEVVVTGGTATSGTDFTGSSPQILTFPAGSTAPQTAIFTVVDDTASDANETIELTLQNVTGGNSAVIGTPNISVVTITDDETIDCTLAGNARINEFHYDNSGADVNEFIEIRIQDPQPDPSCLNQYEVILYNGNNNTSYATIGLGSAVVTSAGGYSYYVIYYNGIQNGAPDGIGFVGPNGSSQLISYEGTLTINDGNFANLTSTDVGVSEPGNANNTSIFFDGTTWQLGTASPGVANP